MCLLPLVTLFLFSFTRQNILIIQCSWHFQQLPERASDMYNSIGLYGKVTGYHSLEETHSSVLPFSSIGYVALDRSLNYFPTPSPMKLFMCQSIIKVCLCCTQIHYGFFHRNQEKSLFLSLRYSQFKTAFCFKGHCQFLSHYKRLITLLSIISI